MNDDPHVQELLDEILDSHATPEEVCGSCPELLPTVSNQWRQMCRLRAVLDALFPPADEPTPQPPEGTALPYIPGYEVGDKKGTFFKNVRIVPSGIYSVDHTVQVLVSDGGAL